jgi:hypothetical protein
MFLRLEGGVLAGARGVPAFLEGSSPDGSTPRLRQPGAKLGGLKELPYACRTVRNSRQAGGQLALQQAVSYIRYAAALLGRV